MSSGKNKSKSRTNTTSTTHSTDQRQTETINAGIGGDIDDSHVISGNRGDIALNVVDGGAFDLAGVAVDRSHDLVGDVLMELGGAMFEQQKETLKAANELTSRSMDAAMNLKSGETVADPENRNLANITKTAVVVAGIGGATVLGISAMNKRGKK